MTASFASVAKMTKSVGLVCRRNFGKTVGTFSSSAFTLSICFRNQHSCPEE
jgi:hypothetical protein